MKKPCPTCGRTESAFCVRLWRITSSVWSRVRSTTPGSSGWLPSGWKMLTLKMWMRWWRSVKRSHICTESYKYNHLTKLFVSVLTERGETDPVLQVSASHVSAGCPHGNQDGNRRRGGYGIPRCPQWGNAALLFIIVSRNHIIYKVCCSHVQFIICTPPSS